MGSKFRRRVTLAVKSVNLPFFEVQKKTEMSCATVFSLLCWHSFKAALSRIPGVRRWKHQRAAKDILVIEENQAGTTAAALEEYERPINHLIA